MERGHFEIENRIKSNLIKDYVWQNQRLTTGPSKIAYLRRLIFLDHYVTKKYNCVLDDKFLNRLVYSRKKIAKNKIYFYTFCNDFLEDYIKNTKNTGRGTGRVLEHIRNATRKFFNFYLEDTPINNEIFNSTVRTSNIEETKKGKLKIEDLSKILEKLYKDENKRWYLATILLSSTGCRVGEILHLRVRDLHLDTYPPYINIATSKTKKSRHAYLNAEAKETLIEYLKERKIDMNNKDFYIFRRNGTAENEIDRSLYKQYLKAFSSKIKALNLDVKDDLGRTTISIHNIRRCTYTIVENICGREIAEWYIGHRQRGYKDDYSEEQIKEIYEKIQKPLSIKNRHIIEDVKKTIVNEKLEEIVQKRLVEYEEKMKFDYVKRDFEYEMIRYEQKLKDKIEKMSKENIELFKTSGLIDDKMIYAISVKRQIDIFKESAYFKNLSIKDQDHILEYIKKEKTRYIDLNKTIQDRLDELEHIEMEDDLIKI